MIRVEVDLSAFHRLKDETIRTIQGETDAAVRGGLATAEAYARGHHQHHRQTGHLTSDAIRTEIESTGAGGTMGALRNDASYAGFVEYGTKPHRIYPRNGRALRFEVSTPTVHGFGLGGETVYASYVDHPGTSPMPFMHPAALVGLAEVRRRLEDCIRRISNLWK